MLREVPIEDFDRLLAGAPTSPAFDNVLARTRTISDAPIAGISTRLSRGALHADWIRANRPRLK